MRVTRGNSRRGDTIIEVIFAITIFCMVSLIIINLMNSGLSVVESSMEITMARHEIDSQAETLRFIHNSYIAEFEQLDDNQHYVDVWTRITDQAITVGEFFNLADVDDCNSLYDGGSPQSISASNGFVMNTRRINTSDDITDQEISPNDAVILARDGSFRLSALGPRIIYQSLVHQVGDPEEELKDQTDFTQVASVESIWVTAVKGRNEGNPGDPSPPDYYDMYIRTCWFAPGRIYPTKLGTIVRLYNPQSLFEFDDGS